MKKPEPDAPDRTGRRNIDEQSDGTEPWLEPLRPLDLTRHTDFASLLAAMKDTAFAGRQLGEAADVLYEMVTDPACLVVGTFSGAMTVAKQGLLLCEMIDRGLVQAVVATGALMAHGLVEGVGRAHFKHREGMDDRSLYYRGFDRVYDTLELESNLDDVERLLGRLMDDWPTEETLCSRTFCARVGQHLAENVEGRSILGSAWRKGVPVYIPAFTDSVLGLDLAIYNRQRRTAGRPVIHFDPFLDLDHYTELVGAPDRLGIFTIGGGVPRNWAQQVGPYIDYIYRRGDKREGGKLQRFRYAVRICPEPVHWGGLSGCTYSEGISWGKFVPPGEGGRFAEVHADATIGWPVLLAAVLQRLGPALGPAQQ